MIFDFSELEEHSEQIAQAFKDSWQEANEKNFYLTYGQALQKAVSLGYNTSIICPIMLGSPTEWANFHLVLANEITRFTSITPRPACLISGGKLDASKNKNQKFAEQFATGLNREHPLSLTCYSASGGSFIQHYQILDSRLDSCKKLNEEQTNKTHASPELDLRVILIPKFDNAKIKFQQL